MSKRTPTDTRNSAQRSPREPAGYEPLTGHGPKVRTDVVDVYVFRRATAREERAAGTRAGEDGAERNPTIMLLQLLRAGEPMKDTWQPVMGHLNKGETAWQGALRELREETGLREGAPEFLGFWALEQVYPFYIAAIDTIVMSPRFVVEVSDKWSPVLNGEHSELRWVHQDHIESRFLWPGQRLACRELVIAIADPASISREALRVPR
jgi:8-oxo-dGTP pyrophosphatase MutT (NUDIX family)